MNILQIINSSGLGGAETIVKKILEINKSHKCFCLFRDGKNRFEDFNDRVYYGLNKKGSYKFNIFIFLKLYKIIKDKRIDIIHVHLGISLLYGAFIKIFRPSIILIYHEHGEIYYNTKLKYFLRLFNKIVNKFIAVSETTKTELIKKSKIKQCKVTVIYNYVDLESFNKSNNNEYKKHFNIGFVGRVTKIKGLDILIESLLLLDFKYTMYIAGDGDMLSFYKKMVKNLGIEKKVFFLGYVNNIIDIYNKFDICICSSYSEAFPLSIIEAQASGVPVIASNISSINEIIIDGNTGLLFKVGDKRDLANKINKIYYNRKLYEFVKENAIKNVRKKYSLNRFMLSIQKVYYDI